MKRSSRNIRSFSALAALLITSSLVLAATPKKGEKFPDLAGFGLEGSVPKLEGKVVLVDFFASWCGPCQESFPAMEKLQKTYAGKSVVIIAINLDKKKADMEEFLKAHPVSFTILRDATYKLVNQVQVPTMPSSFLLDQSGKVYSVHRGFEGAKTVKQYTDEIEALLKNPSHP